MHGNISARVSVFCGSYEFSQIYYRPKARILLFVTLVAMSSVQQLSISSVGAARGPFFPQRACRSVCRSLFGAVDHEELNRDIEAKLREISERDQKRWNFNFVAGTPLLGDYEWEGTAAETTPAFYQESVQVGKRRAVAPQVKPHTEAPNRENCARKDAASGAVSPESASTGTQSCTRRKTRARFTTTTSLITGGRAAGINNPSLSRDFLVSKNIFILFLQIFTSNEGS